MVDFTKTAILGEIMGMADHSRFQMGREVQSPPNYAHSPLFAPTAVETMLLLHLLLPDENDFTSLLH